MAMKGRIKEVKTVSTWEIYSALILNNLVLLVCSDQFLLLRLIPFVFLFVLGESVL